MAELLAGKVAVVTGGGAGIGEAIARRFAAEGCRVVVADRQHEAAARVADAISGLAVSADVSAEAEVVALVAACDRAFGRLDILVNNAGIIGPFGPLVELGVADWDAIFATNVRGVMLCIKHAVPLLRRQGGAIINLASRVGLRGRAMQSGYSASKFAVVGLTESVAQELGPLGIRVNAICPGAVATPALLARLRARAADQGRPVEALIGELTADAALGKLIGPAEVAETALFLASDAASAITGASLRIDAGRA